MEFQYREDCVECMDIWGSRCHGHAVDVPLKHDQWLKNQQEYLEKQAPLRAAWLNGDEAAGEQLHQLVAETTAKCPPITGTFHYTQEQVDEAKKAGLS